MDEMSRRDFFRKGFNTNSLARLSGALFGGLQGVLKMTGGPVPLEEAGLALRGLQNRRSRQRPAQPKAGGTLATFLKPNDAVSAAQQEQVVEEPTDRDQSSLDGGS